MRSLQREHGACLLQTELKELYVAATRAKKRLFLSAAQAVVAVVDSELAFLRPDGARAPPRGSEVARGVV